MLHWLDLRDKVILYLAATLALQSGEIARLRPHHLQVNARGSILEIHSKSGHRRWMNAGLMWGSLQQWKKLQYHFFQQIAAQLPETLKLFELHFGSTMKLSARCIEHIVGRNVRAARTRAGLPHLPFSYASFRLARAQEMFSAGMTEEEAAYFFGWSPGRARKVWVGLSQQLGKP